jgi:hypothetical protein
VRPCSTCSSSACLSRPAGLPNTSGPCMPSMGC